MKHIYIIFLLCSVYMLTSCIQQEDIIQDGEEILSSIDVLFDNGSTATRSLDMSTGYDGVVKKIFVANDIVDIYKNDNLVATAEYDGDEWTLSGELKFIKGSRTSVRISYRDEAHAIAVYDRTELKTTEPECWGTILKTDMSLTAVLKHSKALVSVADITSVIGELEENIDIIVGGNRIPLKKAPSDKRWQLEELAESGETLTAFVVTLKEMNQELTVPVETPVLLEANKHYIFSIALLPGEYRAWIENVSTMGTPPVWDDGGEEGAPQMAVIETEAQLRSIKLDGMYILANDIELTSDWVPIGTENARFTGELDGNGYVISKLKIGTADNPAPYEYAGLFGYTDGATIINVHVNEADIYTTGIAAGVIVGCAVNTTFDLCSTSPLVLPENMGDDIDKPNMVVVTADTETEQVYAGGLVGLLHEEAGGPGFSKMIHSWALYTHVYAVAAADQKQAHSGGLVGRNNYGGMVGCYSYQPWVYATGPTTVVNNAAGLIGSSVNDSRNQILAFGCCAREKYSECSGSAINNSGDLIAEADGESSAYPIVASCWAWKNNKHVDEDNLLDDFIVSSENLNIDSESCLKHNSDFSDFVNLYNAENITFNDRIWEAGKIWVLQTNSSGHNTYPYLNLYYYGK